MQTRESTVPAGAIGLIVDEVTRQNHVRWTVRWFSGNLSITGHYVSETTGYGYNIEVIDENR